VETEAAVGGCGSNKGCGVGSSRNKVEANNMCAQDLSNARDVDALVAGSLRVQQPYGDKDERQEQAARLEQTVVRRGTANERSQWREVNGVGRSGNLKETMTEKSAQGINREETTNQEL